MDLENVYYFLKRRLKSGEDAVSAMVETLRALKLGVKERFDHDAIILFAYGDFEPQPARADPERARAYGQAGRERAATEFSWQAIADATEALYREVAQASR